MRRNDVASTSVGRHFNVMCLLGSLILNIAWIVFFSYFACINCFCFIFSFLFFFFFFVCLRPQHTTEKQETCHSITIRYLSIFLDLQERIPMQSVIRIYKIYVCKLKKNVLSKLYLVLNSKIRRKTDSDEGANHELPHMEMSCLIRIHSL